MLFHVSMSFKKYFASEAGPSHIEKMADDRR